MFYLIVAILFSSMLSLLMRTSEGKIKGDVAMLAMNYITCIVVAALDTGIGNIVTTQQGVGLAAGLGVIGGIAYLGAFVLLQYNIKQNGVVLPATFMKLGLLVPVTVSLLVFKEAPSLVQIIGFCIAIIAIILINFEKGENSVNSKFALIMLLICAGLGDVMSKIHEEIGNLALADNFLLYIFVVAGVLCVSLMLYKKQRIGKMEFIFGVLMGVPNYLSSKFLLVSLNYIPAVIAFPTFSVGCIVVITLTGLLVFREKLTKKQATALGMIMVALAMLNM